MAPPDSDSRGELVATLRLAIPIALAQFGFIALTLVDTAVVGRTSTTALAGAAIGRSLVFAVSSIGMGIASAIEPLASQAYAANEPDRAWQSLRRTLITLFCAWPLLVMTAFGATAMLPWLGVDAPTLAAARDNLVGQVPVLFLFPAFIAAKSFLQAEGHTRSVVEAALLANLVNWIACNLLVRGDEALRDWGLSPLGLRPHGTLGAGFAASIAAAVMFGWLLRPCFRRRVIGTTPPPSYLRIVTLGVPMGLQLLAEIGVFSLVSFLAAKFGTTSVAAHQIALGLASFSFMGALGVSGATAVRVGRAIGLGQSPRRAGMIGIATGGAVMTVSIFVFTLAPRWLVQRFTTDPEVLRLGVPLMAIAAMFQFFDGMQVVAGGALRGAGDVRFAFFANLFCHWCIGLPISIWLGFYAGWQIRGFWVGLCSGLIAVALTMTARFFSVTSRPIVRV